MSNILTQAQAAAIVACMRACKDESARIGITFFRDGLEVNVHETLYGVVVVRGQVRADSLAEWREEKYLSQLAFAEAYGQPTDHLMPF